MTEQRTVGGHFQIVSRLSSGGFGQTFLAEDGRFPARSKCVVKQLRPQTNDPEVIRLSKRLFEQEVDILYQLGAHPQIPSIVTHFEEAGEFYFVQEYIEGKTFAEELAAGRIFSQRQAVEIIADLLGVLAFVHSRGVIHRDVKPSNLISRRADGKTVLIDFGAVKQVRTQNRRASEQATQGTIAIGSEGYMPMEQLAGQPRFSSDVYAAGMFAIQLLTQTHPTALRQNQRTGEWIWQDKVSVHPPLAEFLNRMVRFDFRQRFTDAIEALRHLQQLDLNQSKSEKGFWNPNEAAGQPADGAFTKATFFSPAVQPAEQFAPPPFNRPQFAPPNRVASPPPKWAAPLQNVSAKPVGEVNMTAGGLGFGFDDIRDNPGSRTVVILTLLVIVGFFTVFALVKRPSANPPYPVAVTRPGPPAPRRADARKVAESPVMAVALEKEKDAQTAEEWESVAREWDTAANYFKRLESVETDSAAKNNAWKDWEFCESKKRNALSRITSRKRKNNF